MALVALASASDANAAGRSEPPILRLREAAVPPLEPKRATEEIAAPAGPTAALPAPFLESPVRPDHGSGAVSFVAPDLTGETSVSATHAQTSLASLAETRQDRLAELLDILLADAGEVRFVVLDQALLPEREDGRPWGGEDAAALAQVRGLEIARTGCFAAARDGRSDLGALVVEVKQGMLIGMSLRRDTAQGLIELTLGPIDAIRRAADTPYGWPQRGRCPLL